jgi:Ca2+-binding EF-hand superfamily protein
MFLVVLALSTPLVAAEDPAAPKVDPEKLSKVFEKLDANADGKLSKDEFKGLADLGQGKLKDKPEVIAKLFERLDANKDGSLTLDEFKKLGELKKR